MAGPVALSFIQIQGCRSTPPRSCSTTQSTREMATTLRCTHRCSHDRLPSQGRFQSRELRRHVTMANKGCVRPHSISSKLPILMNQCIPCPGGVGCACQRAWPGPRSTVAPLTSCTLSSHRLACRVSWSLSWGASCTHITLRISSESVNCPLPHPSCKELRAPF